METSEQKMSGRVLAVEELNHAPTHGLLTVVPTYDEKDNVAECMARIAAVGSDLLIVDDASPDGTAEIVRRTAASLPVRSYLMRRRGKLGLGSAYVDAYGWALALRSVYPIVIQMDVDFSHDPAMIPALAKAARISGIAVGSRYVPGGSMPDWPLFRRLLSHGANLYASTILNLRFGNYRLRDGTAGFVAWRHDALEVVFSKPIMSNGYAFQIESKFRATRLGYHPAELPIVFRDRRHGVSKISRSIVYETLLLPWKLRT
jgi:dolichol-phosphate mannosyltransferase